MSANTQEMTNTRTYKINIKQFTIGMLVTLVITSLYVLFYQGNINHTQFLILISFLTITLPILLVKDIFHPFVILLLSSGLALINFWDHSNNRYFLRYASDFTEEYTSYATVYSLVIFICWHIFLYIGYFSFRLKNDANKSKNKPALGIKNKPKIAFFLFVLSIFGFLGVVVSFGNLESMIQAMVSTTQTYSGKGYFRNIVSLGGISSLLLVNEKKIKTSLVVLVLTMVMLSFFGGRGAIVLGTLLPYLMVYHYKIRKFNLKKLIPFIIIGILFVVVWEQVRRDGNFNFENLEFNALLLRVAKNTRMADILPSLVGKLKNGSIPFQYGEPLVNILYAPIPRAIWQGKPQIIDESVLIGSYLLTGQNLYGLPAGPYGWAYFNFGFLGVIFSGLFTGVLVKKVYLKSVLIPSTQDSIIIYSLTIRVLFEVFSTSAQINLLWYVGIFTLLKFIDRIHY